MLPPTQQFAALGDPIRWSILTAIAQHPMPVTEIARLFPVSRPAISQHLRVLHDAGLVCFERSGNKNTYRMNPAGLASLRAQLDTLWETGMSNLKMLAESTYNPGEQQ